MSKVHDKKGTLVVISGFSGSGKGTVMSRLMEKYDSYSLSVSVTTRAPREGEKEGISYFFRTKEEFEELIRENRLIEYAEYQDNYYGTPREYVESRLSEGRDVILEIETVGARKIKELFPESVCIFITPNSFAELKERLYNRKTETEAQILGRLRKAAAEVRAIPLYDHIVLNETGKVEECVDAIHGIIEADHARVRNNTAFVERLNEESKEYA